MPAALTGKIWILHALDVGDWISLKQCREILSEASTQQAAPSRRAPSDFGLDPQPVVWEAPLVHLNFLGKTFAARSRALIYDFGVMSQSFCFDFNGTLDEFHQLAIELSDYDKFAPLAREQIKTLSAKVAPAIDDLRLSNHSESYFVFQIDPSGDLSPQPWMEENKKIISQILRGERTELSQEERDESVRYRISYSPTDFVLIDWAAALIIDKNYEDTLAVLEFANSELLELRILDDRLDHAMDEFYQTNRSRQPRIWSVFKPYDKNLRRLMDLMADASIEFEAVNNAIKLTNDQYLARVYRLATERFHLGAFDRDIDRKLKTLWEIHNFFTERTSTRRLEVLEWIVIILIAIEILPLFH